MNDSLMAKGSIAEQVERGKVSSLAEAFLNVKLVLLCDCSDAMHKPDAYDYQTCWQATHDITQRLQREHPGEVLVVSFAENAHVYPSGLIPAPAGVAHLLAGLRKVYELGANPLYTIIISNGEWVEEESSIVSVIQRDFLGRLDAVYVGTNDSEGTRLIDKINASAHTNTAKTLALPFPIETQTSFFPILET